MEKLWEEASLKDIYAAIMNKKDTVFRNIRQYIEETADFEYSKIKILRKLVQEFEDTGKILPEYVTTVINKPIKNYLNKFTFLTNEQIFGDNQLDIIRRYGLECAATDFAILLGCLTCSLNYTSEGERACAWWT